MNGENKASTMKPGRLAAVSAAAVLIALIAAVLIAVGSSSPALADHNSLYLVCPDPIQEGNSGQMKIKRSGYRVAYAVIFTHQGAYTAGPEDFEEYNGVKFESGSGDKTLRIPINTKEDSSPEHDERFAIGFSNDGVWHQCIVTIEDDDAPEIVDVDIISRPTDGYAYRAGESIDVGVDLDANVEVDGTPLLSLFIGEGSESTWRGAEYHSGSGSRSLVFRYQVDSADQDTDGVSVASAYSGDDGKPAEGFSGNIYAEGTDVPIDYAHTGIDSHWKQKVDGRPYVQSARYISSPEEGWDAYRANQAMEISMTFDTDVVVEGEVTVDLLLGPEDYDWDEAVRKARYLRGSATDTLVFSYTVSPGDTDDNGAGLSRGTEQYGFGGDGTIKGKGTDVERNPYYQGWGHEPGHRVDTVPPSIESVAITSRPANGSAYAAGERITAEATFSEQVTPRGGIFLELDVGGVARNATLPSGTQGAFVRSLVFQYEVQEGDTDVDGIGIGANKVIVVGGIYDNAGNSANFSHPVVAADPDQKVQGSN